MSVQRTFRTEEFVSELAVATRLCHFEHYGRKQNRALSGIQKPESGGHAASRLCWHAVLHLLAGIFLGATTVASAQEKSPDEVYRQQIDQARAAYRVAIAKDIREAKRVEVLLLRFDDLQEADFSEDQEGRFPVAPYEATTSIISQKVLDSSQAKELLLELARQIEKPVDSHQFLCHLPVHGIRVYSDEPSGKPFDSKLIYAGTFSWVCHTFSFTYPEGADWLTTSSNLKGIFNKLLPIPKAESERLEMKYRGTANESSAPEKLACGNKTVTAAKSGDNEWSGECPRHFQRFRPIAGPRRAGQFRHSQ